jgi:hypothetical protein
MNRLYHFWYFAWMSYMLFGALRAPFYRKEMRLVAVALTLFAGYAATAAADQIGARPVWDAIRRTYSRT